MKLLAVALCIIMLSGCSVPGTGRLPAETKNITYNPITDRMEDRSGNITLEGPDSPIDMYFGNWRESMPIHTHGSLIERDVLVAGDPDNPPYRGAVLKYVNRFTHATLPARAVTTPVILDSEQEVLYIISGTGEITAGDTTADLHRGNAVLVPAGLSFTMRTTGEDDLTMYLVAEPTPPGFQPRSDIVVVNENLMQIDASDAHWIGIVKNFFDRSSGLATVTSVLTCAFSPGTFFHPHTHFEGCEEVWTAIDRPIHVLMGKQIRMQPPGTGYCVPPDGNTPHGKFNVSDDLVTMFYFSVRKDRVRD